MDNLKVSASFVPHMSVIIYKNVDRGHSLNQWYLETHDISSGQMSAGKPLTNDCLSNLTEFLTRENNDIMRIKGLIPDNLLYHNLNAKGWPDMIWHVKSGPKEMYFSESLNIPNGKAQSPSLVFAFISGRSYVFAVAGNNRPEADTQLYQPPFHNCAANGSICLGNAKLPKPNQLTWESMMQWHETKFWRSVFTHNGGAGIKGNLNLVWKQQILNPAKKFNNKVLLKSKFLKEIL
jgi:PRTRC genetic system protein B